MKRIAVPSNDGVSIAGHFGRSDRFVIFDTDKGRIERTEIRANTHTPSSHGECDGSQHGAGEHSHSHADILTLLQDCRVVLCRGMGWRAAESLKGRGIEPIVVGGAVSAQEAVEAYLGGTLSASQTSFCRCHG